MFGVIAKVTQVDVDVLSEDIYLREPGVDSLSSLEITSELTRTVRIDDLTGYMLFGAVSIGDVVKHLRFATRPSFALMGTRFMGHHVVARQGPELTTPRFNADEAKYCFVEVPSHFLLAVLGVDADAFWKNPDGRRENLEKGNTCKVIQTPLEGYSIRLEI